MAISDKDGNVVYRFVYDTYGELNDIQNGNKVSLKTAEETSEYTLAELADAAGIEYLYNGKYGVTTDSNGLYYMRARYYDQDIKRFINRDVLSGDITNQQPELEPLLLCTGQSGKFDRPVWIVSDSGGDSKNRNP